MKKESAVGPRIIEPLLRDDFVSHDMFESNKQESLNADNAEVKC